jgi:hypothetical protein
MATHADTAAFGFAQTKYDDNGTPIGDLSRNGLTKREYFAAQAMQGLVTTALSEIGSCEMVAAEAVKQADALIAALNQEP